jgi:type VI secretion system protein ImpK
MSNSDNPFGGSGRGDRTIIRPNPAGRRPPAPANPPAQAPYPSPSPGPFRPSQPAPPASVSYPAPPSQAPSEDWVQSHRPRQADAAEPARVAPFRMDDVVAANDNPIMRAGGPLLLLLGGLRVASLRASPAQLMEQVADAIKFFEKDIRSAGIPEDQANLAKYILCATADDIVQNIPTEDRHVWTQYSMLSRFFGERIGGVRFFEELDRALKDPLLNYSLLELMHACLALGFQGIHRTSGGGQGTLQQIQRNLYEVLRRVRPRLNQDLSPRWQGQAMANESSRLHIPVWAVAAVAALLLFGVYIGLRTWLGGGAEAAAEATSTLHPSTPILIERRVFATAPPPPPPPPAPPPPNVVTQLQRIRAALGPEIAAGKVSAVQTANNIIIRVGDVVMFRVGDAKVLDQFKPIAARIAATLDKEPGGIKIVGHSDSTPIRTVRFQSNWHLSVERAKAVAALIRPALAQPNRVETDGKGAEAPVASNATAEGRARNRRVEVLIPRAD